MQSKPSNPRVTNTLKQLKKPSHSRPAGQNPINNASLFCRSLPQINTSSSPGSSRPFPFPFPGCVKWEMASTGALIDPENGTSFFLAKAHTTTSSTTEGRRGHYLATRWEEIRTISSQNSCPSSSSSPSSLAWKSLPAFPSLPFSSFSFNSLQAAKKGTRPEAETKCTPVGSET